jgi:ubiquinone/menaquinone biosynthesis C-methylase UbiE
MTNADQYALAYTHAERQRLQRQALELAHESHWLFDRLDIPVGGHVVELGCGPHGCLDLLAERVGPSGHVIGIESNPGAAALARPLVHARGLTQVDVRWGDARATGVPRATCDAVTERRMLIGATEPHQIMAEAVALRTPGGWLAFHETDDTAHVSDPPSAAAERLFALMVTSCHRRGFDPFLGRTLPRLLREAHVEAINLRPFVQVYAPDSRRRTVLLDMVENLGARMLALRLIEASECAALRRALRRHLDDPATMVMSNVCVQVWGRTPLTIGEA